MSIYEIAILGDVTAPQRASLVATLGAMVADFGLRVGHEVEVRDSGTVANRDRRAASSAAYFGGAVQADQTEAKALVKDSIPIIPIVAAHEDFNGSVPEFLRTTNGYRLRADDPEMSELAIALLECVGLLRAQRRAFVSYRRTESRQSALQLHDLLSARGFDVFLDTHDIRPGEPFQDVLWHRLCDSDVMIMLDTPTYFESKWTRQELGRACAKEIHVLRVVWPAHVPSKFTSFAETFYLDAAHLAGPDGPIVEEVAAEIVLAAESLRSRSIASRYMSITGRLRAEVEKIGGTIEGIGAHRAIALRLPDDRRIWAYPAVGIPTADLFNDVAEKALRANQAEAPILVYDHIGIREKWIAHLKWLDDNIAAVRAVRVAEAGWALAAWE